MVPDSSFTAMGCRARVVVDGPHSDRAAAWAISRIDELEAEQEGKAELVSLPDVDDTADPQAAAPHFLPTVEEAS